MDVCQGITLPFTLSQGILLSCDSKAIAALSQICNPLNTLDSSLRPMHRSVWGLAQDSSHFYRLNLLESKSRH
jgi:hypothetical protein